MQRALFSRELLTGPPGAGKTHRVVQAMIREVDAGRAEDVLLVTPTASYREHMQNTVVRGCRGGVLRGHPVVTFADLLLGGEELSAVRRELVVRRLLDEMDAPVWRLARRFEGFRRALAEEAEEILQAGRTSGEALERLRAPRHAAFLEFLRRYQAATAHFRPEPRVNRAAGFVLVDGFDNFTWIEQRLLEQLADRAARIVITLPESSERLRTFLVEHWGFAEERLTGNHRSACAAPPEVRVAATRELEAEYVAREIQRLARQESYAWREVGVILQNPAAYHTLLADALRRAGIPARFYFPRQAADTPLGRHLLACLRLFTGDRAETPDTLLEVLKSPYGPVSSRGDVLRFEFAVIEKRAAAQRGAWELCAPPPEVAAALAEVRRLEASLRQARSPAALAAWVDEAWRALLGRPSPPPAADHEQALAWRADAAAWARLAALPGELATAAEEERVALDAAGFLALLSAQIRDVRFRVRDRRTDAVAVMNAYEARQWELRVVFVAGMVEGEFPAPPRGGLFLDDGDRQALGLPAAAEQAAEQQRLFTVAATRARERVVFTYPRHDHRGKTLLPSFYLEDLAGAAGEIELPLVTAGHWLERQHERLGSPWEEPAAVEEAWAWLEGRPVHPATALGAAAISGRGPSLLWAASVDRLRERETQFSASRLAAFAQCPFQHFAASVLRLRGRPKQEAGLTPLLQGTIVHATLYEWENGGRAERMEDVLERCFARETAGLPLGPAEQQIRLRIRDDLRRFALHEAEHGERYKTRIAAGLLEKQFGRRTRDGDQPVLAVVLEDGSSIELNGRLDRVETFETDGERFGLVVDFKYSKRGFDDQSLEKIEKGEEFQIPLYLLALEETLNLAPAGAELYTLRGETRRRGVYCADLESEIFRGQPPEGSTALPGPAFRQLLETGKQQMAAIAGEVRAGRIAVQPRDTRFCRKGGCDYYDLCRVERWELQRNQRPEETG